MCKRFHVKYQLFVSDFKETLIFSQSFEKKIAQISSFIKIRQVVAELFHADGQTDRQTEREMDMTKLIVAFRNFENAPTNAAGPSVLLYTWLVMICYAL